MRKGGVVLNLWLSSSSKTAWILDEQKITKNGDQSTSLSSNKKVSPVVHTHTHTVEYYSAMKKSGRMPFTAIRMDLEIIID